MSLHRTGATCVAVVTGCALWPALTGAQTPVARIPRPAIEAVRTVDAPKIDGKLMDEVWASARPAAEFSQIDPDEGMPATETTEIRVLYDDNALYIGARLFDRQASLIARRLSKRDEDSDSDRITIYLDPMHDRVTGVYLCVSAAGVQKDAAIFNDSWTDSLWDAVWESAVSVDADGWSAEMRIPLSQLRYSASKSPTWGINAARFIRRRNETDWFELVPKAESGLASRMAPLTGLEIRPGKTALQLLPYTAMKGEVGHVEKAEDPYNNGARGSGGFGADFKWGVTSNLFLDATVNPDFGQVEVDPAVVNLSAFETFFDEKRSFFLEGYQVFNNFGRNGPNSFWGFNTSDPTIFYTRRIGRSPQISPDADFVDAPIAATILGAVKLTTKTKNGWTVALLDAVTGRETARTMVDGIHARTEVEPGTNYFVGRVHRDIGQRAGVGMMATAVARRLTASSVSDVLVSRAYVAGGDGYWFFNDRKDWVINGRFAVSRLSGSQEAIEHTQRSSLHYFQRPDAPQVALDPARTSLAGFTGRANLNRNSGLWQVNAAVWAVSPGFDSNDLGFLTLSDRAGGHVVLQRRNVTPDRFSRSRSWWVAKFWTWNFNREMQADGVQGGSSVTFRNYWSAGASSGWRRPTQDDRLTRGGASTALPSSRFLNVNMSSDSRKWFSVQSNGGVSVTEAGGTNENVNVMLTAKPSSRLTVSAGPQWSRNVTVAQYIKTVDDLQATATYGQRDVFGALAQRQVSGVMRVNAILTRRMSLQVYAQPLRSAGRYRDFKELALPGTFQFARYGRSGTAMTYDASNDTYLVEPDIAGGAASFSFDDPDFTFRSLRLSSVFRWELKPGSTLYAVWTRQREDEARDVLLAKVVYWLGR